MHACVDDAASSAPFDDVRETRRVYIAFDKSTSPSADGTRYLHGTSNWILI